MRYCQPILVMLAAALSAHGAPLPGYYDSAKGKTGAELRLALHAIVRNHNVIPYSSSSRVDTSDALKILDCAPDDTNNVLLIYSTNFLPASTFGLTTGWNREHLWCNSYGLDEVEPAYSDLHNLRACDANVNSSRNNKFYDVSDTNNASYKSPAHAEVPLCSTDSDSWEPPDFQKGDIARALFYMMIRYTGDVPNEPALVLTDNTDQISSSTNFMGRFGTLIKWHLADPVSPSEELRNDLVCSLYQTNRNPFVDHPEWVAAAFLPRLDISNSETNVMLSWSADGPTMIAEQAGTLIGPWTTITNEPTIVTNQWTLVLQHSDSQQQVFRLCLP